MKTNTNTALPNQEELNAKLKDFRICSVTERMRYPSGTRYMQIGYAEIKPCLTVTVRQRRVR